jgi:hypothetical protein
LKLYNQTGTGKDYEFEAAISLLAGSGKVIPYDVSFRCGNYEAEGKWSVSTGKTGRHGNSTGSTSFVDNDR